MEKILKIYIRIVISLFPLFFLPIVLDNYGYAKNWFLGMSLGIGMVLWVAKMIISKNYVVKTSRFWWVWMAMTIWGIIGWWRQSAGVKARTMMDPLGMGTLIIMAGWIWLWLQTRDEDAPAVAGQEIEKQFNWLTVSGAILAVFSVISFMIPASRLPMNFPKKMPMVVISSGWSLAGSIVNETIILLVLASEWIRRLVKRLKGNQGYIKTAMVTVLLSLVFCLDVYKIFKLGWAMLDRNSSWIIATETLKRSPTWGVGAGNFVKAFTFFRPASYNLTAFWTTVFIISGMGLLQVWTELGMGGLVAVGLILGEWLRLKKNAAAFWQIGMVGVALLLLPVSLVGVWLWVWLAAEKLNGFKERKLVLNMGESNFNVMPYLVGVIMLAGVGWGGWQWMKMFMGEIYLRRSLVAAGENKGGETYDWQIKAIGMNPNIANYRRIYSQTNMALAQNILAAKELSDEDKQKAGILVQQAVREGKAAIALEGENASYWENLGEIYKKLIGLVDGSADWAFQALQQAVVLDPVNPLTRLNLGGLLYAARRFEEADRVFEEVVVNKQDFANGWYNWAYSAKNLNKLEVAIQRLNQALALVPAETGDFEKASKELGDWRKEYEELLKKQGASVKTTAPEAETLKTAEPIPTAGKEEKVDVPKEQLEPPKVTVTPTETPEATPTPTPTPTSGATPSLSPGE